MRFFVLLLCVLMPLSVWSSIVHFTDQAVWQAQLGNASLVTDDFVGDKQELPANTVNYSLGFSSISLLGGVGEPGPTGLTGKGYLSGEVDAKDEDRLLLEFSFVPVKAFALTGLINDSLSSSDNLNLQEIAI